MIPDTPTQVVPVVMAGGSGTRLWPLSRAGFPKQFLELSGTGSLFQQAVERLQGLAREDVELLPTVVIANEQHRFLVLDQLQEAEQAPRAVLLEPCARNTAPALTLAALLAAEGGADPVLFVTPADQSIADPSAFSAAARQAIEVAALGGIALLGVPPLRPETGFGYVLAEHTATGMPVRRFVEKPDLATAQRYLAEGRYFWNSGMFVLRASTWLAALAQFRPDILAATKTAFAGSTRDALFIRPDARAFEAVPSESIDYAVMERCPGSAIRLEMVPLEAGWNDLGAWDAVWQVAEKDGSGNAASGDTMLIGTSGSLVRSTSRLVGVLGLENVVVVETPDAVLVADRSASQDVKRVMSDLEARGRSERDTHRKVHRPWGWYDSIDSGPRFQVKRILVKPGASLSLQLHHHRAEHWIVVRGTAEVTCGDKVSLLSENESTFIPLGLRHRLANPGRIPLEIIEVQSGQYLGEDDIVRFDDTYGRT